MQYPLSSKLEKAASRDASRPVLTHCFLRDAGDGTGTLEATDSYKLARLPVTLDEGDVEGFVPVEALAAARKNRAGELECGETVNVPRGASFPRIDGQFPRCDSLFPTQPVAFTVGLNAKLLHELAQAIGTDTVQVSFVAGDDGTPNPLRPIIVTPANGSGIAGADGLIMPIRVQG